jgi:pimeloyl-ACP methyl ester carboxylesterase
MIDPFQLAQQATDYWIDAWQRSILMLDVQRQRGNESNERAAETAPHVLSFRFELLVDGSSLPRPVNYGLLRIVPPEGVEIDPDKRPFIVFDPRAGHGPGIGGMKQDSEIGVVLKAGHPCYFVGFLPKPEPTQTIEDVCRAEAHFIELVASLHPDAEGKPALIGNCQAGWQIMMTAALRPDITGPVMLAGAPLSYWGGVRGGSPLRYLGGLLGGTWLTALSGDLGNGKFDGAHLVHNFEMMNPANTWWKKDYHVYSKIDTEAGRFLEFEKWWGTPVLLNAQEMQYIADNLFVGNRLSNGTMHDSDGRRIDLRNISAPIIVFCSWGDDITPPQQALGWVLDLYEDDAAMVAAGQTVIYSLHQTIGHLGIFVSASVANKEHSEFTRSMDLIDLLPPGLYEAVFVPKDADTANAELAAGDYVVRFERRFLDDLRALGGNDEADERRFATVARLSEINLGLYRNFLSPLVKAVASEPVAQALRDLHPYRLRYGLLSDKNPFMSGVAALAEQVRAQRKAVDGENVFLKLQEAMAAQIVATLDQYKAVRDQSEEAFFLSAYGQPLLQALVGLGNEASGKARQRIGRDLARESVLAARRTEAAKRLHSGGEREAVLRAILYIARSPELRVADERAFATLRALRQRLPARERLSLARFKEIVQEQNMILQLDEEKAMEALPSLLPGSADERIRGLTGVHQIMTAAGPLHGEAAARMQRVAALFGAEAG